MSGVFGAFHPNVDSGSGRTATDPVTREINDLKRRMRLQERHAHPSGGLNRRRGDTDAEACRVEITSAVSIPTGSGGTFPGDFDVISWDAATFDNFGAWNSGSPTRLTAQHDGVVVIICTGIWPTGGGQRYLLLSRNGSYESGQTDDATGGGFDTGKSFPYVTETVTGDYFELWVYQTSGGPLLLGPPTSMSMAYL